MNITAIRSAPNDLAVQLRALADAVERSEITSFECAYIERGEYTFLHGASLSDALVLTTLLQDRCIARMRA